MRGLVRLITVLAALADTAVAAGMANVERGRSFYENHCQMCHTPQVHKRINKLPVDREESRRIVDNWQRQENLRRSGQGIADVVEFLNQTRYRLCYRLARWG